MANDKNLKSFTEGDPRINRRGRPKYFDIARKIATAISKELVPYGPDGSRVTVLESILRDWVDSGEFRKQLAFVQYAFGKLPKNNVTDDRDSTTIITWGDTITSEVVYHSDED